MRKCDKMAQEPMGAWRPQIPCSNSSHDGQLAANKTVKAPGMQ